MNYYFPHDCDAMNDDKLLQLRAEFGLEGYALFFMCLETMSKNEAGRLNANLIGGLSVGYGVAKVRLGEFLEACVGLGLFEKDEVGFFSQRMIDHLEHVKKLSLSGKAAADKRWGNTQPKAPVMPPHSDGNATPMLLDKIRLDEIRLDEIKPDSDVERSSPTPAQEATDFFEDVTKQNQCVEFLLSKGVQDQTARLEIAKFVSYWTEPSKSGKKQRWELEKTFEVRRRLVTWLTNMNKRTNFANSAPKGMTL